MKRMDTQELSDIARALEENASKIDKLIEIYIPRKLDRSSLVFSLNPPQYEYNEEALNKTVNEPIWNFLDRGGKRWRPFLFLLIVEALGKDPNPIQEFAIIPEVIHNGTIMIDDIEDDSKLRRGKPCTHRLYGLDVAINAGNAMYYMPLLTFIENRRKLEPGKLARLYETYISEMIRVSLGQAMDIAWHKGLADADMISEKQYLQMCAFKTGTLARMAAKMAAILCDVDEHTVEKLGRFAEAIGVAFQIQDDVLDLTSKVFAEKKGGRGQDVTEGKRSLIVIHTLEQARPADRRRLLQILDMHTDNQKLKNEAIEIMEKYNSMDYAKKFARNMVAESWNEVSKLLPSSVASEKLRAFAYYMIERRI